MANESASPILRQLHKMLARQTVKDRTDRELLQQFATKRDESSFAGLVERHGPLVWNVCHRVLRDRHDAEDAFQATFLVLARRASSVCKKEAVGSWLYGVAYRTALSQRRAAQRRRRREKQGQVREPEQPASATAALHELQAMLDEEVARLPAKYRAPFMLCCLEGKSYAQVARELGCKEGTVSSRLAKARELLQGRLTRRGVTLSAALTAATVSSTAETAPAALVEATAKGVVLSLSGAADTGVSAQAVILAKGATKTLSATMRKLGVILLLTAAPMACVGFWWQTEPIRQEVEAGPQKPQPNPALSTVDEKRTKPADNIAYFADAEMHVIGVYSAKDDSPSNVPRGSVEVEVRPTAKPIVLVLTAYYSVDWHLKLAKGARIKKVILSGNCVQEIRGLPAEVPVANRSGEPRDGSRRKEGWFWAFQWNTPQWREMVRRLNKETGLPLASFQGKNRGNSFIVDGKRGRDRGQNGVVPRPPRNKELTPKELLAASADAELHIVGPVQNNGPNVSVWGAIRELLGGAAGSEEDSDNDAGKPVNVEVRPTAKPVVLVLTAYGETVWRVKLAQGARIKAVLVGGYYPQEVEGLPDDVPVNSYCYFNSSYHFGGGATQQNKESFWAYRWNTSEYRRMVERLNELTGLLVSTSQMENTALPIVVDGKRGSNFAQKERKPRSKFPKEPTPRELLAAAAGAELHVVSINSSDSDNKNGDQIDVDVQPTDKPIVLALVSHMPVLWNVKLAPGARLKAVIIGGYHEQEFEGIPAGIPIVCRTYFPSGNQNYFCGHEWDSDDSHYSGKKVAERLKELTGLSVATFQGKMNGISFVVDGKHGRDFAKGE